MPDSSRSCITAPRFLRMKLIECVPNFSEGRRPEVIAAIRDAIASAPGVAMLDVSSDPSHNRTVVTFAAPAENIVQAAFNGIAKARDLIDLTTHRGEHPRIGATDVCPFIPLGDATMDDCVALARALGARVGVELGIPVFLYERAASRPNRINLADIRRGEFEKAREEIGTNPDRVPDFGPNTIHPTAGATVIGARPFLVAYNIYLGPASNLAVAKEVAKIVRASGGGLPAVKGLGLEVDGQAQVSMNLTDTDTTPIWRAYDAVKTEAEARGVAPTWSEIVGLVPERALFETAAHHIQLKGFTNEMLLEHKVRAAMTGRRNARRIRRRRRVERAGAGRRVGRGARGRARRRTGRDGRRAHDRQEEVRGRRSRDEGAGGACDHARRAPCRTREGGFRLLRARERGVQDAKGESGAGRRA